MSFIRRVLNKNTENYYVYKVRSYREKGTQKVKQESEYIGIEAHMCPQLSLQYGLFGWPDLFSSRLKK